MVGDEHVFGAIINPFPRARHRLEPWCMPGYIRATLSDIVV